MKGNPRNTSKNNLPKRSRPSRPLHAQGHTRGPTTAYCDSNKLRRFLEKDGESDFDHSVRFLNAAMSGSFVDNVLTIASNTKNLAMLRSVFSFAEVSNEMVYTFIMKMGQGYLSVGHNKIFVQQCCTAIYESRILSRICSEYHSTPLPQQCSAPLAWLVATLLGMNTSVSEDRCVLQLANLLKKSHPHLDIVLYPSELRSRIHDLSVENIEFMQPFHDNDHPFDYRKINVLPTVGELLCEKSRALEGRGEHIAVALPGGVDHIGELLDHQFRYLREDMVYPLKQELKAVIEASSISDVKMKSGVSNQKNRNICRNLFLGVTMESVQVQYNRAHLTIKVCINDELRQQLTKFKKEKDIKEFFDSKKGSRVLSKNSIVIFLSSDRQPLGVAVVVHRNTSTIGVRAREGYLEVGVSLPDKSLFEKLHREQSTSPSKQCSSFLYCATSSLFAYEPVLTRLKDMIDIPFAEELVHGQAPRSVESPILISGETMEIMSKDSFQMDALQKACRDRLCVIQGPPGTGKTFIGVQIAKTLLENDAHAKILCITLTNHAVDSFVSDIIDTGVEVSRIKRLGYSKKISDKIKPCCLGQGEKNAYPLSSFKHQHLKRWREEQKIIVKEANEIYQEISQHKIWGITSWSQVKNYLVKLRDEDNETNCVLGQLSNDEEIDGVVKVGKKGKRRSDDYTYREWYKGTATLGKSRNSDIWKLTKDKRQMLVESWCTECYEVLVHDLIYKFNLCQTMYDNIRALEQERDLFEVGNASIVSCTTNGAATYHALISAYQPTALIIEEAAEILEAHVLVNLTSSLKNIIMIGDHKQLRPKLQVYEFTKASHTDINFDVSLFERLVLASVPTCMLRTQHRMRPEISQIIRDTTYPNLVDAESVKYRNHTVKGLKSNLVFVSHTQLEDSTEDRNHTNNHEAEMVVQTVVYLLQQGYDSSDIVILTPYVGQMLNIMNMLKKTRDIIARIGVLDEEELDMYQGDLDESNVLTSLEIAPKNIRSIRVATVDNFQGEEAKIIVASLVRSDINTPSSSEKKRGNIGFLCEHERVNVLFSRARDGLIVFGNVLTLENSKASKLWKAIIDYFRHSGYLFSGLPTICANHKRCALIKNPSDFEEFCPSGGCTLPCGIAMSSCPHSHSCSRNCHPPIAGIDHSNLKCLEAIKLLCKNKLHELTRECGSSKIPQCHHTVNSKCKRGIHNQVHKCSLVATRKCTDQVLLKCSVGHDIFIGCSKNQTEIDALCKTCSHLKMTESHINNEQLEELQIASTEVENAQVLLAQAELEAKHQSKILNMKKKEQEAKLDVKVVRQFMAQQVSQGSMQSETCETVPKKNYQSNHVVRMPVDGDTNCVPSKEIAVPDTFHGDASLVRRYKSPEKMAQDDSTSNRLGGHSSNNHQLFNETPSNEINENICLQESESNYNSRPQDRVFSGELFDTLMNFVEKEQWEELCNRCCDPEIDCAATQAFKVYASFMEFGDIDEALDEFKEIVPPKNYQYSNNIADLLVSCVEVIVSKNSQSYVRLIRLKNQLATSNHKFPNSFICQIDKVFNSCESCNDAETKSESTAESSTNSAQSRWESCKMEYYRVEQISEKTPSQAIDSLMDMVGLESVKLKFVDIYESVKLATEKGSSNATSYNLRCDGNPGTGKTTVARLYSKLLIEVGVLPETAKFEETTGSKLICDGVRQLKSQLEALKEEGGGVIFVDEAYQFDPQNDKSGAQLLNFILPCAESLVGDYGSVVWVFAGYQKDMEKMFTFNPGLPDRFPLTLSFEDFSFSELECVFRKMMHQGASSLVKQEKVVVKEEPTNIKSKPRHWSSVKNTSSLVKDEWGNKWTPNSFADSWTDEHGNSCAYGPNNEFNRNYISSNSNDYRLGGESNPLIDKKGLIWLYDRDNQLWLQQCDRTKTKRCYPGKMQTPTKQQKIMPYEVVDEKWVRIAIRRLASMRGRVGFGNARAVRNLFDRSVERQSARITRQRREGEEPNIFMFERDDLLGPKANDTSLMNSEAYKELLAMEGLEDVKNVVNDILKLVIQNADREDNEKELLEMNLNRIFLGNPGTGKTTVAKLYGLILKNLGLLSKGELLCKASSDFVGGALGSSEILTRAILRSAEGCVLIIDEAYALNPVLGNNGGGTSDPYRAAVLDTIVEQVQGVPTEDRVVIMIGYKQEMEDMFRNSNPGLARRFQADMPVSFEDYDTKSLRRIMKSYAKKKSLRIPFETLIFAVEQVEKKKALPNFGNAGAVLNMLKKAQSNLTSRDPTSAILMKEDFSPGDKTRSLIDIFSDVSGCENIVLKLNVIEKLILNNRKRCQPVADSVPFNFLFVGAPGTGKTTIARKFGEVYHSLGILPTKDVVEVSVSDLMTGYAGQTGKQTREIFDAARGKVLFVDEAYQLNPARGGPYAQEAVDEIVKCLTHSDFKEKIVVIFAGYVEDINEMLTVNKGLQSRFQEKIEFQNFSREKTILLLKTGLEKKQLALNCDALDNLNDAMDKLVKIPTFSNGRDIDNLVSRVLMTYISDFSSDVYPDGRAMISWGCLNSALSAMISERSTERIANSNLSTVDTSKALTCSAGVMERPPPRTNIATTQQQHTHENNRHCDQSSEINDFNSSLFDVCFETVLNDESWNSADGVKYLSGLPPDDPKLYELACLVATRLKISKDEAMKKVCNWREKQLDVQRLIEEQEEEQELARKQKRKAKVPIWQCQACGRACKPFIVCHYMPRVIGYSEIDVSK